MELETAPVPPGSARWNPGTGHSLVGHPLGLSAEPPSVLRALPQQVHEPVSAATTAACRERGLPLCQFRHDRRDYSAGMQAEVSREAVGTANFSWVVSEVLPHNALSQVGVHYRAV